MKCFAFRPAATLRSRGRAILFANSAFAQMVEREADLLVGTAFQTLLSRGGSIFYETQFAPSLILRGHLDEISFELRSAPAESASGRQRPCSEKDI